MKNEKEKANKKIKQLIKRKKDFTVTVLGNKIFVTYEETKIYGQNSIFFRTSRSRTYNYRDGVCKSISETFRVVPPIKNKVIKNKKKKHK